MGIIKTLEIIDADSVALAKFEQEIKKQQYKVYAVGNQLLFSFGENEQSAKDFIEKIEEYAFDLDLDYAKVKFFYLDSELGKVENSSNVIKKFAEENDLDNSTGGMPISIVPYLIEYIFKNEKKFDQESSTLFFNPKIENEDTFTDEIEEQFIDDVQENKALNYKKEEKVAILPPSESDVEKKSCNFATLEKNQEEEGEEITPQEVKNESEHYSQANDYLLEKAISIFDSHRHIRLPQFDEVTNKELQNEIVNAQFEISKARDIGIDEIYKRIKKDTEGSKQVIETHVIKQAREAHEEALNTIERNLVVDINKLLTENDMQYEQDREKYVQSRIPQLRKEYDAKHYSDYQSVLTEEINQLRTRSQREIEQENIRFSKYVEKVFKSSSEDTIDNIVINDIVGEYNKIAEEQRDLLTIRAKGLKNQIGDTMSNIMIERDSLKEELLQIEAKIEGQQEKEKEYIKSSIREGIKEEKDRLRKETKKKLDEASKKEQELLRKMEAMNATISGLESENKTLQREYIAPLKKSSKETSAGSSPKVEAVYQKQSGRWSLAKILVGSVVGVSMCVVLGVGVSTMIDIKKEIAYGNQVSELRYLSELEINKKYDKTAKEMERLGYKKDSIALMYLDNGIYTMALKTDSSILTNFYTFVEKQSLETQKEILENVIKKEILKENQLKGINIRLAILEKDTDKVLKLSENDSDSAKLAISYLIDINKLGEAKKLLRTYPDEELSRKLEKKAENNEQK